MTGGAAGGDVAGGNTVSAPPKVRHGWGGSPASATRVTTPPGALSPFRGPLALSLTWLVKTPVMKRAISCSWAGVIVGVQGLGEVGASHVSDNSSVWAARLT